PARGRDGPARVVMIVTRRSTRPIGTEHPVTAEIEPLQPPLRWWPALGIEPVGRGIVVPVLNPGSWRVEHRGLVHDAGRLALQPVIEPREIRIARPEIGMIHKIVLVRPNPQLLIPDPRLDFLKRRQHAGLENVKPAGDMESGDFDRA